MIGVEKVLARENSRVVKKQVPMVRTVEVPVEYEVEKIVEQPIVREIEKTVHRFQEVPIEKLIEKNVVIERVNQVAN